MCVCAVTDERPNLRVAERLLHKAGVPKTGVVLLSSGEEGIAHLGRLPASVPPAEAGQPPHTATVVLLDINLGSMTGFDVVRAVCAARGGLPGPVIACTSYVSLEDQAKFKAAGFAGLLGKPFKLADLRRALAAAAVHRPAEGAFTVHISDT